MSINGTEHFSQSAVEHSDYAIAHNIDNSLPEEFEGNAQRQCEFLEEVRSYLTGHYGEDVKMFPSSFYRGVDLNKAIGGVQTSQHCKGQATDFHTSIGTVDEIFEIICDSDLQFDQLILEYDNQGHRWVHISTPSEDVEARREALSGEKGQRLQRVAVG